MRQAGVPAAQIASWISPAHIESYAWEDGQLCVHLVAPGHAQVDMIERRYLYIIAAAIGSIMGVASNRVALDVRALTGRQAMRDDAPASVQQVG